MKSCINIILYPKNVHRGVWRKSAKKQESDFIKTLEKAGNTKLKKFA